MPLSELLAASDVISLHAPVDPARLRALLADHALVRLPNVLVTPHIAYNTQEAVDRIIESTLGNIEAYAAGAARNVVTAIMPASPSPGGGDLSVVGPCPTAGAASFRSPPTPAFAIRPAPQ